MTPLRRNALYLIMRKKDIQRKIVDDQVEVSTLMAL